MTRQVLRLAAILLPALITSGCRGSGGSGPAAPSPTPTPVPAAQCGVAPAPSNPPGGGGTPAQIQIDLGVYGTADMSQVTVFAFSQAMLLAAPLDPEIAELVPDIVPRAWQRWDVSRAMNRRASPTRRERCR